MKANLYRFCPQCSQPLVERDLGEQVRRACPDHACGYVHWNNPTPVVAAVVEHEGHLILARNSLWKAPFYALITGFLEASDTSPEAAIAREVEEELGLQAQATNFIGHYSFARQNQIIMAFHVPACGTVSLSEELSDIIRVPPADAKYWPAATGLALRDWLLRQGHQPEEMAIPKLQG